MNRALKKRLRSRVIVTLKTGQAFEGVLAEADRSLWVLRNSFAIDYGEKNEAVSADGEVWIRPDEVHFVNRP